MDDLHINDHNHSGYATYFGWNTIFPVVVIVLVSLLTYFIDPKMIELRLSSIIALILALTALQFVIQEFLPDSSYLTPVAQMIVAGYWIMMVEAIETVIVFWIVEYKQTMNERLRERQESLKMEEDKSAFGNIEESMVQANGATSKHIIESIEPGDPTQFDEEYELDSAPDTHSAYQPSFLSELGEIRQRQHEQHQQSEQDSGHDFESDASKHTKDDKYDNEKVSRFKNITRSLSRTTSIPSSTRKSFLDTLANITAHRTEFLKQKSEYKLALTVDMIFLIISALGFAISTILFFALE